MTQKGDSISLTNSLMAAIAIYAIYLIVAFLLRDNPESLIFYTDWAAVAINLVAALCLLYAARVSLSVGKRVFFAWMMMSLGQLCFVTGDAIWAYIETVQMKDPFPSLADIPNLMTYPLFVIGILFLPSAVISLRERITMALDTSIVIITSVLVFWSLIIEPTINQNLQADPLIMALSVGYPVLDLILLFFVVELLFRKLNLPGREALIVPGPGFRHLDCHRCHFYAPISRRNLSSRRHRRQRLDCGLSSRGSGRNSPGRGCEGWCLPLKFHLSRAKC